MSGRAEARSHSSEHRDSAHSGGRLPSSSRSTSAAKLGHRDGGSRRDRPARACESPRGPGSGRRRVAAGWDGWCRSGIPSDRRRDRRRRVEVAPRRDPPPSGTRWRGRTPRGSAGWGGPERELPCRSPGDAGDTGPVAGLHRLGSRSWRFGVGAPWVPGDETRLRRVATTGARAHAHTTGAGSAWNAAVRPLTPREGVLDPDAAAPPEGVDPAPSTGMSSSSRRRVLSGSAGSTTSCSSTGRARAWCGETAAAPRLTMPGECRPSGAPLVQHRPVRTARCPRRS